MDRDGFKFTDHIPKELRSRTDNTEMIIELKNGSVFQVIGTDNVDSFRGANPVGAIFSEYAWQNPLAWDTVRPILNENGGWAIFNTTPMGKNHAYRMYKLAKDNERWFTQLLTVDDTKRPDGTPVIKPEDIEEERSMGMEEDMIEQEYWCSFEAAIKGAYYSAQMKEARDKNRICGLDYQKAFPVYTAWDLGWDDATAIIFFQIIGKEIHIIDAEEHSGEDLSFYVNLLESKPYRYETHFLPHDAAAKSRQTGLTDQETMAELGVYNTEIVPVASIQAGIQKVRKIFHKIYINDKGDDETKKRMERFIDAITQYRKDYDEDRKIFKSKPLHDWASHYSDALRALASSFVEQDEYEDEGDAGDIDGGVLG